MFIVGCFLKFALRFPERFEDFSLRLTTPHIAFSMRSMSNFDTNKYRTKFPKIGTKAYSRVDTLRQMTKHATLGESLIVRKFDNKNISSEHKKLLAECAVLWGKLDDFETALKQRKIKATTKGKL